MIRKATLDDIDFVYGLYMHPAVNPYVLYEQMEIIQFTPIYKELIGKQVKYIYHSGEQAIGMFKLIPLNYRNSHIAYLGGLAIHPDFAGNGAGKKLMAEILNLAKQKGFLRVELSVAAINSKAIHLYEKCGFQKEGLLRNYTYLKSEKKFLDEVMMAIELPATSH